jgi:beta-glucosidase
LAGVTVEQLKKFQRLALRAGEEKTVTFALGPDELMLLDPKMNWVVEPGTFTAMVGAASDDIRLKADFQVRQALTVPTTAK